MILLVTLILLASRDVAPPSEISPIENAALPAEIELNDFFKTLRSPFKAYEAEDPKSLQLAMNDINNREKKAIKYLEKIPGRDYSNFCFMIAALMISLLLGVKYLEVKTWH